MQVPGASRVRSCECDSLTTCPIRWRCHRTQAACGGGVAPRGSPIAFKSGAISFRGPMLSTILWPAKADPRGGRLRVQPLLDRRLMFRLPNSASSEDRPECAKVLFAWFAVIRADANALTGKFGLDPGHWSSETEADSGGNSGRDPAEESDSAPTKRG